MRSSVKELWQLAESKNLEETKWLGLINLFIDKNVRFLRYLSSSRSRSRSKSNNKSRMYSRSGRSLKNTLMSKSLSLISSRNLAQNPTNQESEFLEKMNFEKIAKTAIQSPWHQQTAQNQVQ